MMNETYHDNNSMMELEEMRAQLSLLKQKLNEQEIVNDKMMRKVTSARLSKINRESTIASIFTALFIPLNTFILYQVGASVPFIIVTTLYLLVCILFSAYSRRGINPDDVIYGNLISTKKKMIRYKTLCNRWLMGVIPFLVLWIGWFMLELSAWGSTFNRGAMVGAAVGTIIGTVCGIIYYNKSQKNLNEAIREIEELAKE